MTRPTKKDKKQPISFKFHPEILKLLRMEDNANKILEDYLINHYKQKGLLPDDFETANRAAVSRQTKLHPSGPAGRSSDEDADDPQ